MHQTFIFTNRMKEDNTDLFKGFDSVDKNSWIEKVNVDLKGEEFDSLFWETEGGLSLAPFYTKEDLQGLDYLKQYQNNFVNTRDAAYGSRKWINYQEIRVEDEKNANVAALETLNNGAEGIIFNLTKKGNINFYDLLKSILFEHCHIGFVFSDYDKEIFQFLEKHKIINGFLKVEQQEIDYGQPQSRY